MNRLEEESIFKRFQNNYLDFPTGEIIHQDSPDFIIKNESIIGVEITQVFKDQDLPTGSLIRAKEVFKSNVLTNVVSLLKSSPISKCIISISFNDNLFNKKLNPRTIAKQCYQCIIAEAQNFRSKEFMKLKIKYRCST